MTDVSLSEVLAENYLSVGATGYEAIAAMWEDVAEDLFDQEWLDEMNVTKTELINELLTMTRDIVINGKLNTIHGVHGLIEPEPKR